MSTTQAMKDHLVVVPYKGITIFVMPDYYMEDGIRMPVGLTRAFEIADAVGMRLPTPDMVDAIYKAAEIKLSPTPMDWRGAMTSMDYFIRHDAKIEEQLEAYGDVTGKLIAGHKKDIVNIARNSSKVAIYGWHQRNGLPIQNYNARSHHREYKDYSHGLRLVSKNGKDKQGRLVRV